MLKQGDKMYRRSQKLSKKQIDDYEMLAGCIHNGIGGDIEKHFRRDPEFKRWYMDKYEV